MKSRVHKIKTYVGENTPVIVHVRVSPPEPDVNWPGGIELEEIYNAKGEYINGLLSDDDLADLEDRMVMEVYGNDDWRY